MSAYGELEQLVRNTDVEYLDRHYPPAEPAAAVADKILTTHRAEVLGEVVDRLARRATLYGSSQTVNEVMRDLARLADAAEPGEKDTAPAATSTHQHTPRERHHLLAKAIREQGGEWTTRRARNTYRALGITGLFRSTLRRDLAELHRDGHLTLHDQDPGRRYYTPTPNGGDAR